MAKLMTFSELESKGIPRHWTAQQYREFKSLVEGGQTKDKALEIVFGLPSTPHPSLKA